MRGGQDEEVLICISQTGEPKSQIRTLDSPGRQVGKQQTAAWGQGPPEPLLPTPPHGVQREWRGQARMWNVLDWVWLKPGPDSLMLSMSSESTTERLCSSPAMARSKAFCFTTLLHSWYFILASLSWGFTFTTWMGRGRGGKEMREREGGTEGRRERRK